MKNQPSLAHFATLVALLSLVLGVFWGYCSPESLMIQEALWDLEWQYCCSQTPPRAGVPVEQLSPEFKRLVERDPGEIIATHGLRWHVFGWWFGECPKAGPPQIWGP